MSNCVIITPAHNEEAFIERTIKSVTAQTVRPLKWVVVNDGSTDGTRGIVECYARSHNFITLIDVERSPGRRYDNKVRAFNRGFGEVHALPFDYIGNLDADISMEPTYFENILLECEKDPKLGLAGGMVHSCIDGKYVSQEVSLDSVAGPVQLFRRECFEQIGGYMALPNGGIDAAAEIAARMKGWNVRTFPEHCVFEHRRTGWSAGGVLASRVKEGRRMHSLGYGVLFFALKCVYRSMEKSAGGILGSCAALVGYLSSMIRGDAIVLPPDMVRYLKVEQREKIRRILHLPTSP